MPCPQIFQEDSVCSARETRKSAKDEGWTVGVQGPYHRHGDRLRDYCPEHTPTKENL
jgi:hypothetical protein